jgi:dihydrofolate reductase
MRGHRKVVIFIAASLDGFISAGNDDLSFLDIVQRKGEDYGYQEFIGSVDTVIMGRRTWEWILRHMKEFPHAGVETFIITHRKEQDSGMLKFYGGDLKELVSGLKVRSGKNIFVDGGANIINQLLKEGLIDEMIISFIPVLLGEGIRLFSGESKPDKLTLQSMRHYDSGLVRVHYMLK